MCGGKHTKPSRNHGYKYGCPEDGCSYSAYKYEVRKHLEKKHGCHDKELVKLKGKNIKEWKEKKMEHDQKSEKKLLMEDQEPMAERQNLKVRLQRIPQKVAKAVKEMDDDDDDDDNDDDDDDETNGERRDDEDNDRSDNSEEDSDSENESDYASEDDTKDEVSSDEGENENPPEGGDRRRVVQDPAPTRKTKDGVRMADVVREVMEERKKKEDLQLHAPASADMMDALWAIQQTLSDWFPKMHSQGARLERRMKEVEKIQTRLLKIEEKREVDEGKRQFRAPPKSKENNDKQGYDKRRDEWRDRSPLRNNYHRNWNN